MSHRNRALNRFLASSALALISAQAVWADSYEMPVEEVVITTDPYASEKTIAAKRDSRAISDGISANQVGELPEFGLGDALAAVPGISFVINNGRGEDQFMTIRGLNPDYNSVLVDGMALPSTEETVRSLSFDVLPSVVINQADVVKSWTADLPSDAVGGVTVLRTRSAFDHPGNFISGHADVGYWEDTPQLHKTLPSGQGDVVMSGTFGPNNQFGALVLASIYARSSSTLNTYTLPYSYYPSNGTPQAGLFALDQTSATASNTTLKPSQDVSQLLPIPDRHRWYWYDNERTRPGAFARFDYDDGEHWHAQLSGGAFDFNNDENRYSQYLNRVGPATILSPTTGSFALGSGEVDYDHYLQIRQVQYLQVSGGTVFGPDIHVDLTANYGIGRYRQNTQEDQFLQGTSNNLAFTYNLAAQDAALFTPTGTAFSNPSLYSQAYHMYVVDESTSKLPQIRLDLTHNFGVQDSGFGYSAGAGTRDLSQTYSYYQTKWLPVGVAPTLAAIGTLSGTVSPYNGQGQSLLLVNPTAVVNYLAANGGNYTRNASDSLSNTINNYHLAEIITDGYVQASYRTDQFFVLAGLREEGTTEHIDNYLPVPFNSQTNFSQIHTRQNYDKLLPSLNASYRPIDQITLRAAATRTLGRPEYAQLAENSSATVSGATASESISNPNLAPRRSTNYDLSAEYYPAPGILASTALFDKHISNEILTLTTTQQGVMVPGYATPVALTTTQPENASKARVRGIEFNLVDAAFTFLPGPLQGLGARANAAFMDFEAPFIRMSDGSFRRLPQLAATSKVVANIALFYNYQALFGEVSYNHTGKQPISFDTNNGVNDQWWADMDSVDLQFGYHFSANIDFRVQMKNLTDATPQKVVGPSQNLNYSLLENGRAYFAGVAFHY